MVRRTRTIITTIIIACLLPFAWTPAGMAADINGGRYPTANPVIRQAHARNINGKGVRIAVTDTAPVRDNPVLADADITYRLGRFTNLDGRPVQCRIGGRPLTASIAAGTDDRYWSHGTDMLSWIVGNGQGYRAGSYAPVGGAAKATILHITVSGQQVATGASQPCDARMLGDVIPAQGDDINMAVDWGARIINRSQDGSLDERDYQGYVNALRHGVIITAGRPNTTKPGLDDLTGDPRGLNTFPGVVMTNSVDADGRLSALSDTVDGNVAVVSYGVNVLGPVNDYTRDWLKPREGGTSTATAVLTSYLALAMQQWPKATGNQILQSLIRNTKTGKGRPVIDPERRRGFGEVDLNALLTVDPTQYKDVNPILEYQVKAAAHYPDKRNWYTQDCRTNPNGIGGAEDDPIPCEAGLVGREYERQQEAWKRVEQCRMDGGSDCMRYSATADQTNPDSTQSKEGTDSETGKEASSAGMGWVIGAGVGILITVVAIITSRRNRVGRG